MAGWLTNWLYCLGTDQLTKWFMAGWLTNWPYCPRTDQLTEWFQAYWIVRELVKWLNVLWLIDRLTDSTVQELTNWLNDLWLVDWHTDVGLILFYWMNDLLSWLYSLGRLHVSLVNFFVYGELYGEVLKSLLLCCNSISYRVNGYKLLAQRFLGSLWWTSVSFLPRQPATTMSWVIDPRSIFTSLVIFLKNRREELSTKL